MTPQKWIEKARTVDELVEHTEPMLHEGAQHLAAALEEIARLQAQLAQAGQVVESGCECLECGKTWDNLYNIAGWYHTDEDGDDTLHEDLRDFNTREHVKILRRALQKAYSGLDSAACYFDNQDSPSVVHVVDEALSEARAALEATKEGV